MKIPYATERGFKKCLGMLLFLRMRRASRNRQKLIVAVEREEYEGLNLLIADGDLTEKEISRIKPNTD